LKLLLLIFISTTVFADSTTVGPDGIDSAATGLDGSTADLDAPGIEIGQVEPSRSGKPNYGVPPEPAASNTKPAGVYFRAAGGMANAGEAVGQHATLVAGIMIADNSIAGFQGVAPKANLHSGAIGSGSDDLVTADGDVDFALTANRIARLSGAGVRVRAINFSAARELQIPVEQLDGNSFPTKFVDWSARRQDILYVLAWGNDNSPTQRVPTDNFNGMTVAASEICSDSNNTACAPNMHAYRKFGSVNNTQGLPEPFPRTAISLIAPGQDVGSVGFNDTPGIGNGTSAAAPHVTGTVALLQQYTTQQMGLTEPNPRFGPNSQRHEVMKAVMMNSADKLNGVHGSTRDVLSLNNMNWLSSPAATDPSIPLDTYIGAGHLNAKRSVQQYAPGEYDPGNVPWIAWDYGGVGGSGMQQYTFNQPIGGYIAATLAWDRRVFSTEQCGSTTYCEGDQFTNQPIEDNLNNLELYLMPAASNDLGDAIASSISPVMSVEHIFFNIPSSGNYKLVVYNNPMGGIGDTQNYALAWWNGNAPPLSQPGDHNKDGKVDAADYVVWRNDPASFGGAGGYDSWRQNFGNTSGSGNAVVPEPSSAMVFVVFLLLVGCQRRSMSPLRGFAFNCDSSGS
jgi:hypothetical protein